MPQEEPNRTAELFGGFWMIQIRPLMLRSG
jgi:hypothetical protein